MRKYIVQTSNMGGWNWVGKFIHRERDERVPRFRSRAEAYAHAFKNANFGCSDPGMTSLIAKWVPRGGWRVVEQLDWWIWEDEF